jgi:hypothetical protein
MACGVSEARSIALLGVGRLGRRRDVVAAVHRLRWHACWSHRRSSSDSSRDASGRQQAVAARGKVDLGAGGAGVVARRKLDERNGLFDQTLRREQVCVLEVALVQGAKLVRARRAWRGRECEVRIVVLDRAPEDGDLLDESLEGVRVRVVPALVSGLRVLKNALLLLGELLNPDVDKTLELARSKVRECRILAKGLRIRSIRRTGERACELETLAELLR